MLGVGDVRHLSIRLASLYLKLEVASDDDALARRCEVIVLPVPASMPHRDRDDIACLVRPGRPIVCTLEHRRRLHART